MNKLCNFLVGFCLFAVASASADDIDIYINANQISGAPYVHLMLDWRPSTFSELCKYDTSCGTTNADGSCSTTVCFSEDSYARLGVHSSGDSISKFEAFVAVTSTILSNPLFDGIYMALLAPNYDDGATILKGYRLLGTDRAEIIATLESIPLNPSASRAHKIRPKYVQWEWYKYINGGTVEYGTETDGNFGFSSGTPNPDYDSSTMNGAETSYISPFTDPDSCSKLFSIGIAMNTENEGQEFDSDIKTALNFSDKGKLIFDEMFVEMHRSNQDLIPSLVNGNQKLEKSWIISDSGSKGHTEDWAEAGGSALLYINQPDELEEELTNAFKEIISVSSTFVAASVPVNVFNRAESLDNLFLALFEARSTQDWPGNIKKLKLNDSSGNGRYDEIIDATTAANGGPLQGFATTGDNRGRINFNALTYWTDASTLPDVSTELAPDGVDGREVARGGAGSKIIGFVPEESATEIIGDTNDNGGSGPAHRQVFVEPLGYTNGTPALFEDFDVLADGPALDALKPYLGDASMTGDDARDLIRWGRGQDAPGSTAARKWILSDAIHSRPLAINYGAVGGYSKTNPNIRLFFGTGDGIFHILENTTTATTNNESGEEVFAFYPRELLGNIEIRKSLTEPSSKMRYGIDGAPIALVVDNNDDGNLVAATPDLDKVYVYFGLRRGGYSYYALDVSNPSVPAKILWKITRTVNGDFDELGLTFSKPIVGKVKYKADGSATNVLIFAGGYNGGWDNGYVNRVGKDDKTTIGADNTVGNAIYIVDAETGALIWKAVKGSSGIGAGSAFGTDDAVKYEHPDMVDSIPSNITPLTDPSGVVYRLYVGDTGGVVWRVDIPALDGVTDTRSTDWYISKFADLGYDGSDVSTDRRFFHAPDLVQTFDGDGDFDGIIISSGDRPHPNSTTTTNYHFYLKDRLIVSNKSAVTSRVPINAEDPFDDSDSSGSIYGLPDQTTCDPDDNTSICATDFPRGWKYELAQSGEKGLSTALVDGGRIFMTSFAPYTGALTCEPTEGNGFVYIVNLEDGTATYDTPFFDVGLGIPSGAITLGDNILVPGAGKEPENDDCDPLVEDCTPCDPAVEDCDCEGKLCKSLTETLFRIYWREPGIDSL
ncbi:MAG: hypothetical protein DRR42_11730 [Gammaproteobacteria bacterium]|nr:MAG: hypothetical protein DRR42_11730 [Gammaproteobacteria bacterium]